MKHNRSQSSCLAGGNDVIQAFRPLNTPPPPPEFYDDEDDGPALDFLDRPPARRKERELARLFDILDNLPPAGEETERTVRP